MPRRNPTAFCPRHAMPTREQISEKIRRDLCECGVNPGDPNHDFVLSALEAMNGGMADLDDELTDLAERIEWLAQAATWINQRPVKEFDAYVQSQIIRCELALGTVRARWEKHQTEARVEPGTQERPT